MSYNELKHLNKIKLIGNLHVDKSIAVMCRFKRVWLFLNKRNNFKVAAFLQLTKSSQLLRGIKKV